VDQAGSAIAPSRSMANKMVTALPVWTQIQGPTLLSFIISIKMVVAELKIVRIFGSSD
jgi:hypothetical protein